MNAQKTSQYEAVIRVAAPSIMRVQPAPKGIIISIPKPEYHNRYVGEWLGIKHTAKRPVKLAVKRVLPQGTRVICMLD